MPPDTTERLTALQRMNKVDLSKLWKDLFGTNPPDGLNQRLLIRFLAYRIQEQAFGSLPDSTRGRLQELATAFATKAPAKLSASAILKPGTRLVREWRCKQHVVDVERDGFQ